MPPNVHRKAYLVCLILIAGGVLSVPAFSDPPLLISAEANSPLHPGDELRINVIAYSLNQVNWFEAQVIGPAGTVKSFSQVAEFEPVGVNSWTYTARWQLPAWLGPGSYSVSRLRIGASTSQSHAQTGSSGGRLQVTQRNLQYSEFWPPFSFEIISGANPDVAAEISGETPEPRNAPPAPASTLPVYPVTISPSPAGSVSQAPVPDNDRVEILVAATPEPQQTSSSPDVISLDSLMRGLIPGSAGPLPQTIPATPTVPQPTAAPVVQSPAAAPLSLRAGPEPVATGAAEPAPAVPAQPAASVPASAGPSGQILPAATVSPGATPEPAPALITNLPAPLSLPVPGPEPVATGAAEPAPAVPAQPAASVPASAGPSGSLPAMAINISIPGNGSFTGLPPFPVEIPLSLPVATPATPVPTVSPGAGSPTTGASGPANQDNLPAATGNGTRVSIRELIKQANITLEETLKVDRSAFLHGNLTMGMTDLPGRDGMMGIGNDTLASPDGGVDRINLTMDESPGIDSTLQLPRNITIVPAGEVSVPQWDAGGAPPGMYPSGQAGLQP